jgi:tRNA(fMet)-specific endonuclease VapC
MVNPNRVLLDTNVVIAIFAGDPSVMQRLAKSSETFIPVPVLGELYHGALQSVRKTENLERLRQLGLKIPILPCVVDTAIQYGGIKTALARKGRPIPENDMWIAAIAFQHGLLVLTKDTHFTQVEGLDFELL